MKDRTEDMVNPVFDAPARRAAIDPSGSFIVQAPAGSGKTELLIQRYLSLLSYVSAPEQILAITFTRKAAAEMRARIVSALERAGNPDPPGPAHEKTTWDLARAALFSDEKHGWNIAENPSRLRIMTIDALCASLTRQMPVLSGFGLQPEIAEDACALYEEAAANTVAELDSDSAWSGDIAVLMKHMDNRLDLVASLVADMLPRRDQWLRHVLGSEDSGEYRAALESAMARVIRDTLAAARDALSAPGMPGPEQWTPLARFAANTLIAEGADSPICNCRDLEDLPGTDPGDLPVWEGICNLFLTGAGQWRKPGGVNKTIGFPAKNAGSDPGTNARNLEMKTAFKSILSAFSSNPAAAGALDRIRSIPALSYTDDQWRVLSALFTVLKLAVGHLRLVFIAKNSVDFTEISMRAAAALENAGGPTDLALRLDYTISHILIDEFQDTSISQFDLLKKLTAGWSPEDGRTFFAVGDPMQSIYGFREAEVGIFLNAWKFGLGHIPLTPLTLSSNFRSEKGIVEWVNRVFPEIFPESAGPDRGAVPYTPCSPVLPEGSGPSVYVHALFNEDADCGEEAVVECIERIRKNRPDDRLAVLVRSRPDLGRIVPALRARGLRFSALEIDPLESRPVVKDLVSLTRALVHPADRVAWLAVLRAPWCGMLLDDLHALAGEDNGKTIPELMHDSSRIERLSCDGKRRLLRLREVLDEAMEYSGRRSLARLVEAAWLRLGGPACGLQSSDMADARAYLGLLEQTAGTGTLLDDKRFYDAVSELYAPPDPLADDRLQIMTIHKAKGLEFEAVIIFGLEKRGRREDDRLLFWMERPDVEEDQGLLMAPIGETGGEKDPTYRYIKGLYQEKRDLELGRLLYVAVTRAKKELHLFGRVGTGADGSLKVPVKGSLLRMLWPAVAREFENAVKKRKFSEKRTDEGGGVLVPGIKRLSERWVRPLPGSGPELYKPGFQVVSDMEKSVHPVFDWAGMTARRLGTVVHQWLRLVCEQGLEAWPADRVYRVKDLIRADMQRAGIYDDALDETVDLALHALINTITDSRGRWILSPHVSGACEYALSGVLGNEVVNAVIDRTFVDGDGISWIIDYKISTHSGGGMEEFLDREQLRYKEQMDRYAFLMRAMSGRAVRLGLYYPLLRGWREWEPDENVMT